MPGVTISAGYGAGGTAIANAVAVALSLPLLDRAISAPVAAQLHVTVHEAETAEFERKGMGRFFGLLAPLAGGVLGAGTDAAPVEDDNPFDEAGPFRERPEATMTEALERGAVVLGRAGGAAFRDRTDVLRVRLFGSPDARVAHAQVAESVDDETARNRMHMVDHARAHYVRRLYGCDIDDPALYQLQIDSTQIAADACVDIIVRAYRALVAS